MATHDHTGNADEITPQARTLTREDIDVTPTTSLRHDPNGGHWVEQTYVQYFVPQARREGPPVVLVHGGGLTGSCWETTPDGRPGWLHRLLERGREVHVVDLVERGRAGWRPDHFEGEAITRSMEETWTLFRIGAAAGFGSRTPFAGQRFPVDAFETFCRSFVPRWLTTLAAQATGLGAVLEELGGATLIAHSHGCQVAFSALAATAAPVDRLIALEPSGLPAPGQRMAEKTTLAFGDYLDDAPIWSGLVERCRAVAADDPMVTWLDLTQAVGPGFSHMIMMDRGSEDALDAALS
jgi:pimeloyl-ACP methyl ester carboxylesterase